MIRIALDDKARDQAVINRIQQPIEKETGTKVDERCPSSMSLRQGTPTSAIDFTPSGFNNQSAPAYPKAEVLESFKTRIQEIIKQNTLSN